MRHGEMAAGRASAATSLGCVLSRSGLCFFMQSNSLETAAIKLTEKLLGRSDCDLADILGEIAAAYNFSHIAHLRFSLSKSAETILLNTITTYSREWRTRYFLKNYLSIDPVIQYGRDARMPFDWQELPKDNPKVAAFFADAIRHKIGRNGITIPVRSRKSTCALVSFSNDVPRLEWESLTTTHMVRLQHLSALIDAAAFGESTLPRPQVQLSRREEQCLIWIARGKTQLETAEILTLRPSSVRAYLDTARHKLHCINLTHAVSVAIATGLISPLAMRDSV